MDAERKLSRNNSIYQYIQYHDYLVSEGTNLPTPEIINKIHSRLQTVLGVKAEEEQAKLYTLLLRRFQKGANPGGQVLTDLGLSQQDVDLVNKTFSEMVEAKLPNLEFDLATLTLSPKGDGSIPLIQPDKTTVDLGKNKQQDFYKLNSLTAQVNILKDAVTTAAGGQNTSFFKDLQTNLEAIETEISKFQTRFNGDELISQFQRSGDITKKSGRSGIEIRTIAKSLNNIAKSLMMPKKTDIGNLAEWYYGYVLQAAQMVALRGFNDLEKFTEGMLKNLTGKTSSVVVGGVRVNTVLKLEGLSEVERSVLEKNLSPKKSTDLSGNAIITSSQGTADISITLPELKDCGGGKLGMTGRSFKMNASVKNYAFAKDIHIVSGTPVTALVALYNSNFIQHYYNLIAQHENQKGGGSLDIANDYLLYSGIYRGLAGIRPTDFLQGTAQFFIVNDRSGNVTVYSINAILQKVFNQVLGDRNKIKQYAKFGDEPPARHSIPNEWSGEAYANSMDWAEIRSAETFARIHQQKVSIILKISEAAKAEGLN